MSDQPTEKSEEKAKVRGRPFKKGICNNPGGRPKLDPELKKLKSESLAKIIELFHARIHDDAYMKKLDPMAFLKFVEVAGDRFGMPRMISNEISGGLTLEQILDKADGPGVEEPKGDVS